MTKAKLRAGAILAALKNRKTIDLRIDSRQPCVQVPPGLDSQPTIRLALGMRPRPNLRVSGLGLHADIQRNGVSHRVCVPWHAITEWRASR